MRSTQRKGDIAKAKAILTFTEMGFDVATLLTESAAYDILVDDGFGVWRVQVKFCGAKNRQVDLRQIHSNSMGYVVRKTQRRNYDWLYVLDGEGNQYLLKECLIGRNAVSLNVLERL